MNITDSFNRTLTNPALPDTSKATGDRTRAQKEQLAKDFESVFIEKLLDEMKNTVGDWGFEQDGAAKQIQGLFWMNLARDVSEKGGLGMWKDIYQSLNSQETDLSQTKMIDNEL